MKPIPCRCGTNANTCALHDGKMCLHCGCLRKNLYGGCMCDPFVRTAPHAALRKTLAHAPK
jgi:hypothetical protein